MATFEIRHYLAVNGQDPYLDWLRQVRDKTAKVAVMRRVNRIELGNFGDHNPCREGVRELRVDLGPGYRVYYAQASSTLVLLLCGGDKRKQDADIARACGYWRDWQSRDGEKGSER